MFCHCAYNVDKTPAINTFSELKFRVLIQAHNIYRAHTSMELAIFNNLNFSKRFLYAAFKCGLRIPKISSSFNDWLYCWDGKLFGNLKPPMAENWCRIIGAGESRNFTLQCSSSERADRSKVSLSHLEFDRFSWWPYVFLSILFGKLRKNSCYKENIKLG